MENKLARARFCNHYRPMSEYKKCFAGVAYDTMDGVPVEKRPCFRKDLHEPVRCGCDLVQFATDAEIDEAEKWMAERFRNIATARSSIVDDCGGPWKKGMPQNSGVILCPVCKIDGALHFSRSSYNGHIHAACDTADCVRWME